MKNMNNIEIIYESTNEKDLKTSIENLAEKIDANNYKDHDK